MDGFHYFRYPENAFFFFKVTAKLDKNAGASLGSKNLVLDKGGSADLCLYL
jgi:hypothetical protein